MDTFPELQGCWIFMKGLLFYNCFEVVAESMAAITGYNFLEYYSSS